MESQYKLFFIILLVLCFLAVIYLIGSGSEIRKTKIGCPVLKSCGPDEKVYLYSIVSSGDT